MNKIVIIGGGTFNHISCHLALAAPAFGATARDMARHFSHMDTGMECVLKLTKMADHTSDLITNDDVARFVAGLCSDPLVKIIVLNAAICDFSIQNPTEQTRLSSQYNYPVLMKGITNKIIAGIKALRPDIVVCGFKTTHGATRFEQEQKAAHSMEVNNLDFVVANDLDTRCNMLLTENASFIEERSQLLRKMLKWAVHRVAN